MAMGLSVAPLGRIYFFLAYYWVDFSRCVRDVGWALAAMDGYNGRSSSPCLSLLLSLYWGVSATLFTLLPGRQNGF
jgi:hypothetical protein